MVDHYYSKKQKSELKLRRFEAALRGNNLVFQSSGGIFSPKKIDFGSMLLIENAVISDSAEVLDLGCGYGPVGIAIAKSCPGCTVTMSDVNERAVMLARMNIASNKIGNAKAVASDAFQLITGKFDAILLNPPQSAGREICYRLIAESFLHLKEKGALQLVARKNKGGQMLAKKMEEIFGNVSVLAKKGGFWVYLSAKD